MPGRSHFNLFNKDTRDLFMLCIVFMCHLYHVLFIAVVSLFCLLFDFHSFFCSTFVLIRFFCFSFIHCSKEKDSVLPVVHEVLYKNTITIYASQ